MKKNIYIIILIFTHIVFLSLGYFLSIKKTDTILEKDNSYRVNNYNYSYKFISPLLDCGIETTFISYKKIETKINDFINQQKSQNKIDSFSLFFRLAKDGAILDMNSSELYAGASLMKLPLSILFFKLHEEKYIDIFQDELFIDPKYSSSEIRNIGKDVILPGKKYKIIDLIKAMIIESDNVSTDVLTEYQFDKFGNVIHHMYDDFYLNPFIKVNDGEYTLSTKTLTTFFRILYNASYLNKENSEYLLSLFSQTKFHEGIKKYLSKNIPVVSKFGERGYSDKNEKQLHECGIVYLEDKNYFLCIMTKGTNFKDLQETIAGISKIIYDDLK